MAKATQIKTKLKTSKEAKKSSFFDFLRFGESYTSLILGIIVVVIATVLLLSFVRNKNMTARTTLSRQQAVAVNTQSTTQKAEIQNREQNLSKAEANPENTYTIEKGDTLWKIAEKTYKSGYNWVDIAKANHIDSPDTIYSGNKLTLPKVESKIATVTSTINIDQKINTKVDTIFNLNKITESSYIIERGDNLWTIAVRAYGDGYKWPDIAKANGLISNPNLIHSGNLLKIPRG